MRVLLAIIVLVTAGCGDDDTGGGSPPDAACEVGAWCGNDCLANNDACWACGELRYDAACQCRPVASTCFRPDCSDPAPAQDGDYCGMYWWCDRACAAGLACRPRDATPGSYLQTCQPP
jgi:hypothetical protein